ncbi:hypothetical protein EV361DRAFT_913044 [Lentinula raphanica]|nr:hypothetical protein EV361DRAFT_913044 [Lentinula raphanica]
MASTSILHQWPSPRRAGAYSASRHLNAEAPPFYISHTSSSSPLPSTSTTTSFLDTLGPSGRRIGTTRQLRKDTGWARMNIEGWRPRGHGLPANIFLVRNLFIKRITSTLTRFRHHDRDIVDSRRRYLTRIVHPGSRYLQQASVLPFLSRPRFRYVSIVVGLPSFHFSVRHIVFVISLLSTPASSALRLVVLMMIYTRQPLGPAFSTTTSPPVSIRNLPSLISSSSGLQRFVWSFPITIQAPELHSVPDHPSQPPLSTSRACTRIVRPLFVFNTPSSTTTSVLPASLRISACPAHPKDSCLHINLSRSFMRVANATSPRLFPFFVYVLFLTQTSQNESWRLLAWCPMIPFCCSSIIF